MNTNKALEQLNYGIALARKTLKNAPEGRIQVSSSRNTIQFYILDNGKKKYLSKVDDRLLKKYAQKVYSEKFLKTSEILKKQLTEFIDSYDEYAATDVFENLNNELKKYVKPFILTDEQFADEWVMQKYETKGIKDGQKFYTTENGERVRSKSELTIANKMFIKGIKYRYEQPLYLKGYGTIYPDFTILNPHTHEEIYLEHFGLMGSPDYVESALKKLNTYSKNEILLGQKLFITYESDSNPLDTSVLESILDSMFL